jgi:hypothetical protein
MSIHSHLLLVMHYLFLQDIKSFAISYHQLLRHHGTVAFVNNIMYAIMFAIKAVFKHFQPLQSHVI